MKEVVLPSGRFAAIRPITWRDRIATWAISNLEERVFALALLVVTIDGAPLVKEQAEEMELTEVEPIIDAICKEIIAGVKSKGVA